MAKLDRFFRNLRIMLNRLHELEGIGVKFVATQEGLDTATTYGKFAVQIMGVIAEFERGRIGERVRDSRRYRISQGCWPSGRTLYGYRWLANGQKWEVDESEADVVRYIYHLYLEEGLGTERIPFRLNEEGYQFLAKRESELLRARDNLDPHIGIELDDLELSIALLEKAVDGKSGRLLLTELGIRAESLPEDIITGSMLPAECAWDEPGTPEGSDFVRIGNAGPVLMMVDRPVEYCNLEIPRQTVEQNIRKTLESLGVRVYLFHDRAEIRGFIPTELMDIPHGTEHMKGEAIISSVRG